MLKDDVLKTCHLLKWEYPNLKGLQEFCLKHLEWPEEYTASKVLSITTNHYLDHQSQWILLKPPIRPLRGLVGGRLAGLVFWSHAHFLQGAGSSHCRQWERPAGFAIFCQLIRSWTSLPIYPSFFVSNCLIFSLIPQKYFVIFSIPFS